MKNHQRLFCVLTAAVVFSLQNVAQSVDVKSLDADGFFPKDERQMEDPFTEEEGKDELGITITGHYGEPGFDARPVTKLTEVQMLFKRELVNLKRDTTAIGARLGLTIFMGILIGIIFLDVAESDRTNFSVSHWLRLATCRICFISSVFSDNISHTECSKHVRRPNHDLDDGYVWHGAASFARLP